MATELKIGVSGAGVLHTDERIPDIDEKFRMIRDSGAFDYFDRLPPPDEFDSYVRASAKYNIPIASTGFYYMVGRDEKLLNDNLRIAKECGATAHNVQIFTKDAEGGLVSNDELADLFIKTAEAGDRLGVTVCFENHINMWSEHPGRVMDVAEKVMKRGVQYAMTMDHSHVIFKMDNPAEQKIQDLDKDVASGTVVLDPFKPNNVTQQWIDSNTIVINHARPAVPANPINVWAKHPDGRFGRGVQYPWFRPEPGQWHSEWEESRLEPWKQVMRNLLSHHARTPDSRLRYVSLEMIPPPDYGAGAKYSIFEHNVACARWLRSLWRETVQAAAQGPQNGAH